MATRPSGAGGAEARRYASGMDGSTDLNERFAALRRAIAEVTLVVEALAEMISASGMAAARDLLTPDEADDVATQMKVHLLNAREALHQASRPAS